MKLEKFLKAAAFRICGGDEFQWDCYPNARYLMISDTDGKEVGQCLFSVVDQTVYEIDIFVDEDNVAYRWSNSAWVHFRDEESEKLQVDPDIAYDDLRYTDIKDDDEILVFVEKIVHKTYVHSHVQKITLPE